MCVLASAVDIDLLTHREAVTGYPAGHRLASFCAPPFFYRIDIHNYVSCVLLTLPL